jgi:hypothetical protein
MLITMGVIIQFREKVEGLTKNPESTGDNQLNSISN